MIVIPVSFWVRARAYASAAVAVADRVELTSQSSNTSTCSNDYGIVGEITYDNNEVQSDKDYATGTPKVGGIFVSTLEGTYDTVFSVPSASTLTR